MPAKIKDPVAHFWAGVAIGWDDECWEWQRGRNRAGYGTTTSGLAHRKAWELTNGPIPEGICVLHHCDNRPCCNPAHLWDGTRSENNKDRMRKGRGRHYGLQGERHHRAKITEADVRAMRAAYVYGKTKMREIGAAYGLSPSHAKAIITGTKWRHVEGAVAPPYRRHRPNTLA